MRIGRKIGIKYTKRRIEFWSFFWTKFKSNHWNHFKICPNAFSMGDPIFSTKNGLTFFFTKTLPKSPPKSPKNRKCQNLHYVQNAIFSTQFCNLTGSVLMEKNVWSFLVEKMGSPIFYSDRSSQSPIFSLVKINCLFGKSILPQPHSSANSVGVKRFSSCQFSEIKRRTYALSPKSWSTVFIKERHTRRLSARFKIG